MSADQTSAELQTTSFPIPQTFQRTRSPRHVADRALNAAVRFWFAVVLLGQTVFAFTVASYYGGAAIGGHFSTWNRTMAHGYIPGDRFGNVVVGIHLLSAVVIIMAGLLQLIPQIRERAPALHRWNGRLYIVVAFSISIAGLYMFWVRGGAGDLSQYIGTSIMAVLIMIFAALALRYAMIRDFKSHRRWALRLYIVVSASLFIRAGLFLSLFLNKGPFGFDPSTSTGPFLTFIVYAQYLIPLAVLELYLRTKERAGAAGRFAMAGGLVVLTLALALGVFAVTMGTWVPKIKKAYDGRQSIGETMSATIATDGIDKAIRQYHVLKATRSAAYNFDRKELNALGYELLRSGKVKIAIRVFQLNTEAYPESSNAFDSLGEAYMTDGNKPLAIASYRKALQLDPKSGNAVAMLRKLTGRSS